MISIVISGWEWYLQKINIYQYYIHEEVITISQVGSNFNVVIIILPTHMDSFDNIPATDEDEDIEYR